MRAFVLFFVAAFAVRVVVAWATGWHYVMRRTEMTEIARSLVVLGEYANPYFSVTGPTAHSTPLFPLFIAGMFELFGNRIIGQAAVFLTTCAVCALRCALVPLFAADAGLDRRAALLAGALSVFYIAALETEIGGGLDGPFVALALLAIAWMSLRLWRSGSWRDGTPWTFFALCGVSALLNPQLLAPVVAFVAVAFCFCPVGARRILLRRSLTLAAFVFLCLLPWGIRNWKVLHSFILLRDNFGLELWLANGPDRNVDLSNYSYWHPSANRNEAANVAELGEVRYNQAKLSEAIRWIRSNPAEFARLTGRRVFAWWFPPGSAPVMAAKWLMTLLSFLGLVLLWRRHRLLAVLFAATWVALPALYYVLSWSSRYRYPMEWQLVLCAAVCLTAIAARLTGDSELVQ